MEINDKEISSLMINNKEVQLIVKVSDNTILYEKTSGISSISLTSNSNNINIGTSIVLTATVLNSKNMGVSGVNLVLFDGSTNISSSTTNSNGVCTFNVTPSTSGSHAYHVTYQDENMSSSDVNVTVNKITPSITITSNSSSTTPSASVTVSGYLKNGNTGISGATITLYDGSTSKGTCTTDSNGYYSKSFALNSGTGTHTLKATNTADNTYNSVNTTVNVTARYNPSITVSSNTTSTSPSANVTISGYLKNGSTGINGVTITIYDGSTSKGTCTTNSSGYYSKTITLNSGTGTHSVKAISSEVTDYWSTNATVSITARYTPTISISSSATNTNPSASVTVSGYLKYGSTNIGSATVTIYDGSTSKGTCTTNSSGYYSKAITLNSGTGTHTLKASYGGDSTYWSANGTVNVNAKNNSTISITSNSSSINAGSTVTISGTLNAGSGQSVKIYQNNSLIDTVTTTTNGAYSKTVTLNSSGTYTFKASYDETSTYWGSTSTNVSVTVNKNTPTLSIASSSNSVTVGSSVTVSGTLSAGTGKSVKIYQGDSLIDTVTTTTNGAYSKSVTLNSVGTSTFKAVYDGDNSYWNSVTSSNVSVTVNKINSTINLSSNNSSITVGESVTLSGTLSVGTGQSVKIYQGDNLIDTVTTTTGGAFSKSVTLNSSGSYTFKAIYDGDTTHTNVTSTNVSVTVNKITPTISLSSNNDTINVGSSITLSGTLSAGTGQSVKIYQGSTLLDTVTTGTNGTFSKSVTLNSVGTSTFKAVYDGNSTYWNGKESNTVSVTVNKINSTISLSVNSNSVNVGNSVTLSGTLSAGTGQSVKIYQGDTLLDTVTTGSNGAYSKSVTLNSSGTYTFKAVYDGSTNYTNVTSSNVSVTVNKITPTLSLSTSNASSTYGSNITLSGTLSAGANKSVKIYNGNTLITTVTTGTNGTYSYSTSSLNVGAYTFKATYEGDSTYNNVTSSNVSVTVNKATPTITMGYDGITDVMHSYVTPSSSVTVTGYLKIGNNGISGNTISIYSEYGNSIQTLVATGVTDSNGYYSITFNVKNTTGTLTYSAVSTSTDNYNSSVATQGIFVFNYASLSLSVNKASIDVGETITLSGTSNISVTSQNITIYQGNTLIDTIHPTSNGNFSTTVTLNSIGSYNFKAKYEYDKRTNYHYWESESNTVSVTVNKIIPELLLSSSESDITLGQSITLSGSLSVGSGQTVYIGDSFHDFDETITTGANGSFSTTVTPLSKGNHLITVYFEGNDNYESRNERLYVRVDETPSLTLSTNTNSITYGDSITLSGTLSAGTGQSVKIYDGNTLLDTVTTGSNGAFSKSITPSSTGSHSYKAVYDGNSTYYWNGNESNTVSVTVNKITPTITIDTSANNLYESSSTVSEDVTVSGYLKNGNTGINGATITIYDGSTSKGTCTTNSSGYYSKTISITSIGTHSLKAISTSDNYYNGVTSTTKSVTLYYEPTLTLTPSTITSTVGGTVTLSGTLNNLEGGIGNAPITIYDNEDYDNDNAYEIDTTTMTDGTFSVNLNTDYAGTYHFDAWYDGDAYNIGVGSNEVTLTVKEISTLTLNYDKNNTSVGNPITLSGTLNAGSGQSVKIYQGNTLIDTVTTTTDGAFSKSVTLNSVGTFTFKAEFEGSSGWTESISSNINIYVYQLNFPQATYTATNGECSITCTLAGPSISANSITLTGTDGSSYTGTTNSNGQCTFALIGEGNITYTATASNNGATASCLVNGMDNKIEITSATTSVPKYSSGCSSGSYKYSLTVIVKTSKTFSPEIECSCTIYYRTRSSSTSSYKTTSRTQYLSSTTTSNSLGYLTNCSSYQPINTVTAGSTLFKTNGNWAFKGATFTR